jgi:hypothetical protein
MTATQTTGPVPPLPPLSAPADILAEQKIAECWGEGMSLAETQVALQRLGVGSEREEIRLRFVDLAGEWG